MDSSRSRSAASRAAAVEAQRTSFASVADAYDRARPGYPPEAARWLVGTRPSTVLEVGAGTGKLTDRLLELRHDVLATDPLQEMLDVLVERHPDVRVAQAPAEQLPVATRSVDTVVAAQCFHWFDHPVALKELARVLKPEGRIALVWNERDERVPWVRKLSALLGEPASDADWSEVLVSSGHFGYVETETFRHWQPLRKDELRELVRSRSYVAVMDPMAQERLLRKVDELFDDYDRGPDGLLMPYLTRCFRAVVRPRGVIEEPEHSRDLTEAARAVREAQGADGAPSTAVRLEDDPATTLIDFR